jgi:hypothetical protein
MKKLTKKQLERMIEQTCSEHGFGIPVNIMDLGKIWKEVETAIVEGRDHDQAAKDAYEKYKYVPKMKEA